MDALGISKLNQLTQRKINLVKSLISQGDITIKSLTDKTELYDKLRIIYGDNNMVDFLINASRSEKAQIINMVKTYLQRNISF